LQLTVTPVWTIECAEVLKLLCVALLDDLHLSLECDDALRVANNPNPWMENSQRCD